MTQATNEMSRFTAWLSERERKALDEVAAEQHSSVNLIVRLAVRNYGPVKKKLSSRVTNSA